MRKTKVTNSDISCVIAQTGHFDKSGIGDTNMSMPWTTEETDLVVTDGAPSFMGVLNNVLEELAVQRIYSAEEIKTENSNTPAIIETRLPETFISSTPHTEMRQELNNCHAFIRMGEITPYANTLLESNAVL